MTTHFSGDTAVLTGRSMRHITRSPDTIITTAIMPIALLLLFVYVFGGAIHTGPGRYVTYLLPGILLITIAMGISYTAVRLFTDMQSGIFGRFQSMPIARSSALWSHVLTSLAANLISLVLVVLVAVAMGFRTGAGAAAWLAVAGILVLFTLSLTWIAVIAGLSAKTAEGAGAFAYPIIFLPFISSAFVPTATRPGARLRRQPARDIHRQHHPRPARPAPSQHQHLDRPRLVRRPPHRRVRPRHGHLPPQDRLSPDVPARPQPLTWARAFRWNHRPG
jgi:ABC-2 type transport system permease protein